MYLIEISMQGLGSEAVVQFDLPRAGPEQKKSEEDYKAAYTGDGVFFKDHYWIFKVESRKCCFLLILGEAKIFSSSFKIIIL